MVTKDKEGLQQRQNQTGAAKSSKRGFGWARSKKLSPAGQKPIAYEADPAAKEAAREAPSPGASLVAPGDAKLIKVRPARQRREKGETLFFMKSGSSSKKHQASKE